MVAELQVLCLTAATIGFVHTLLGPDHYLPFLVIGKARNWPLSKIIGLTFLCGIAHVLSSVALGYLGIALQWKIGELVNFESFRGNLAAWALITFGLLYALWGIRHWYRKRSDHNHDDHFNAKGKTLTPWVLIIIFVLGPCEPLIPILMYPAANVNILSMVIVTGIFAFVTISTMVLIVAFPSFLLRNVKLGSLALFSHALAGFVIFLSGLAIQLLGL
jgi:nickel/cobalt exporter